MGYVVIAFGWACWLIFRPNMPKFEVNLTMVYLLLGWMTVILLLIAAEVSCRHHTKELKEIIEQQKEIANILKQEVQDKKINP